MRRWFFPWAIMLLILTPFARAQEPSAAPADPHAQLQQILQRPLYQRWQLRQERERLEEPGFLTTIREALVKFRDWVRDIIEGLFRSRPTTGRASGAPSMSPALYALIHAVAWAALALFVIALAILIWRLVRARDRAAHDDAILSREQVADALSQGDALALRGDQWLDEAGRLATEKDFRAMYRALYLALLSGLHARGKIVFDRHHTNWTYVTRYRGDARERDVFSSLTDLFDSVWYGLKITPGDDIHGLRKQVESLTGTGPGQGEARAH